MDLQMVVAAPLLSAAAITGDDDEDDEPQEFVNFPSRNSLLFTAVFVTETTISGSLTEPGRRAS